MTWVPSFLILNVGSFSNVWRESSLNDLKELDHNSSLDKLVLTTIWSPNFWLGGSVTSSPFCSGHIY